ncbi:Uncharacterized protein PCOAH_00008170 [Plasmodium coatneyi]|uniref:Uncharacterized protein n=1 Tax=Plasmodium coatneyi TaxID=208452 RepID=A0A1B1DUH5_9APIC|nr:Uncharacterized protein PCOAH_00008170 [Plasmodium coatneyi]ANQ06446.1 Uncharacterized protein PCOAH_00008170 [Plasmodium coatneyi]
MFYLYNKFTSASRKSHEEEKDNIVDAGRNVTGLAAENVAKGRSNERDKKEKEEDLFWALEENEPCREGIMKNERHDNGVEKESDIFLASEKMSARCFASEISKQGGDTWWDDNPTWTGVAPLEGEVNTHLDHPNEHHQNGIKNDQTNEKNTQQGDPPFEEFDENSDEFFKIDQDNFSSFTFAASCANEWKGGMEHVENSNDEGKIEDFANRQNDEDPSENGQLFNESSDHVKINISLHPTAHLKSGHLDQTVMEKYPLKEEMASFGESISRENLTRYFNKGEECEEENEEGIKLEGKDFTQMEEKEKNQECIFKEESVLHTQLEGEPIAVEGEEECQLGTIADVGVSYERGSRGESRNTMSSSRGVAEDEAGKGAEGDNPNGAEKDTTKELPMLDPVIPDDEESEWNFFQGVHFPGERQNAAHEGARSGDYSDAHNGESNYWPVDIHSCSKNSEDRLNFCSYEFAGLANINGKEEEDMDTCFDNKKLEKISEELETQNGNHPFENASLVDSEREEVLPKVEDENGKEVPSKILCDEKQTCEVEQTGVAEKWDEEKCMQINTFQRRNIEMDNAKKSFDAFFCRDDEQYEVASMSEKHAGETFSFENKEKVETVNVEKSNEGNDVSVGEEVLLAEGSMRIGEDDFSLFQSEESVKVVEVENEGGTSLLENKQTMEVVVDAVNMVDMMDLLDVVEGDGGASAKERNFFDREETYQTEEAEEECKVETPYGVYSFETVDLKITNPNEWTKNDTYVTLEELTGRNKVGGFLYEAREDTEGIAAQRVVQVEEGKGGKWEQANIEEMNESKGDSHFSGKEMEEIKTVELVGQTEKKFYPHQEEEDSGNYHELDKHTKCLEEDPDGDAKHMLGENLMKNGEELNSILFPNSSNEQFVQEKDNGTENKLEGLLCVPTNMMQKKNFLDEYEGELLPTASRDTNSIRANDIEEENKWEGDSQRECVETVKEPPCCAQIWNEFYEETADQKVNWHGKMIKQNGFDAKAELTNEENFEAANLNDKKEKKKKKKKIKKCRMLREKPFEYHSGSLKYLKALKELPPLDFLKCKDLRPFMRLFNIVLKAVRMFRFNEDYLYVLAGDETGCIYVKLEVKHEKFCQVKRERKLQNEDETFMLANCCVSVEGGHAFLEINEYSDIFSLKYNPIGTVNRSINFSDSKFVVLSASRI